MTDFYRADESYGTWRVVDAEGLTVADDRGGFHFLDGGHAKDFAGALSAARREREDAEKRRAFKGVKGGGK